MAKIYDFKTLRKSYNVSKEFYMEELYSTLETLSNFYDKIQEHMINLAVRDKENDGKKGLSKIEESKDDELYTILNKSKKDVKNIKKYFSNKVKYFDRLHEHFNLDFVYDQQSIELLRDKDVVFFDPDNGIEISSTVNKKKFKYVSYRLLSMFWKTGKTLIIYQHSDRNKKSIEKKISCLSESLDCNKNNDIVIVKIKNVKYIIVINKNQHKFRSVLADFMKRNTEYSKYV